MPLSGKFYTIDGNYLGQDSTEYKLAKSHKMTYPSGVEMVRRRKPMLVGNADELANFITVPSIDSLPKASRGGSGGRPAAQSPLTSPQEEVFRQFKEGMTIGYAVSERRHDPKDRVNIEAADCIEEWTNQVKRKDSIALNESHLTNHYIRAAATGSGKTIATINDILTAHMYLDGPIFLVDPKGGDMVNEYLRAHRTVFEDLEDVEYAKIPEENSEVPSIPFFDIRPYVRTGATSRDAAIQSVTDSYFSLLHEILGEESVKQAFVANEILRGLIRALFDGEHGNDFFSIGDLFQAALKDQNEGVKHVRANRSRSNNDDENLKDPIPPVSDEELRDSLESHLNKSEQSFLTTTDAVLNRIRKMKEREFIWNMLSYTVPESHWDEERNWYDRAGIPMFDVRELLNSEKVIIIDTGDLHDESSQLFSVLFLTQFWRSIKTQWTPEKDDYIANVIMDESPNIARRSIMYEKLLPKGREFNLSLGLIMQYPKQILGDDEFQNRRAYREVLNNVHTKIIGNISVDDQLAESLFHEDLTHSEIKDRINGLRSGEWVVQLPSSGFHEEKPEILTLKPLPIPPGTKESDVTVHPRAANVRERSRVNLCVPKDHPMISANVNNGELADEYEDHVESDAVTMEPFENEDLSADEIIGKLTEKEKRKTREHLDSEVSETEDNDDDSEETESTDFAEVDPEEHLTGNEYNMLKRIINIYHGDRGLYSFGKSMNKDTFQDKAGDALSDLESKRFTEKLEFRFGNYHIPTKDGLDLMDKRIHPEGEGEHGVESFEHIFGVNIVDEYYEQKGYDTQRYETISGASTEKVDLRAENDGSTVNVEVETSIAARNHVVEDLETYADLDGRQVWVLENKDDVEELINYLNRTDRLNITQVTARSLDQINDKLDINGIDEILTFDTILNELHSG